MTDRQQDLVFKDFRAAAISVERGEVADVVAVGLQPADKRIFGLKKPVVCPKTVIRRTGQKRPVVTDFSSFLRGIAVVRVFYETEAIAVISLPGGIGGLEQQVGTAGVIPDNKYNMARTAGITPHQSGDINPGNGVRRNRP